MKGVALPIETIIILALAVIVFGILLWFFASSSPPAIDLTLLKQDQSIYCSSYQRLNNYCTYDEHSPVLCQANRELIAKIINACYNLNENEGGYPSCTYTVYNYVVNQESTQCAQATFNCVAECCAMYCVV